MANNYVFGRGDLVWVKRKGLRRWPGIITDDDKDLQNSKKKVYFFGSNDYHWIDINDLKVYFRKHFKLNKSHKLFKDACAAIEDVRKNGEESVFIPPSLKRSKTEPSTSKSTISSLVGTSSHGLYEEDESSKKTEKEGRKRLASEARIADRIKPKNRFSTSAVSKEKRVGFQHSIMNASTPIDKNLIRSHPHFGFIGLGNMGSGIVKNLLSSGNSVVVWNRTPEKTKEFVKAGATVAETPQDVVAMSDITFSCVSHAEAAKDLMFGNCCVLNEIFESKAYVEMTTIDPETSRLFSDAVTSRGGRYLEAQIQGSKLKAEEGNLIILSAGDRTLYNDCKSCFEAIGYSSFFYGQVGNASKMNLVIQSMTGIYLAGCAEALSLGDKLGLQLTDILEIFGMTNLSNPFIQEKANNIIERAFTTNHALSHMQKDLHMALQLSLTVDHSGPLTAITNELFKKGLKQGYGDSDSSAVFFGSSY